MQCLRGQSLRGQSSGRARHLMQRGRMSNFFLQFCMKLSLLVSLRAAYGGLNGLYVIYIDVEFKFSSKRYLKHTLIIVTDRTNFLFNGA